MEALIWLILIGLAFLWFRRWKKRRAASAKGFRRQEIEANMPRLLKLGSTHGQRAPAIDALFDEGTATLTVTFCASWQWRESTGKTWETVNLVTVSRSLASMNNRERAFVKTVYALNSAADAGERNFVQWLAALLWAEGKGTLDTYRYEHMTAQDQADPMAATVRTLHMTVEQTTNRIQEFAASVLANEAANPDYRQILGDLAEVSAPAGKHAWLRPADVGASPFAQHSDYPLHLGSFNDGTPLTYSGDGSMVTIAPPGAGKTQCNVFPNLLSWQGPAVVLDISGDIYEHTAGWRAENVGPVYKFSPLEPEHSHRYNPLTFVRREADYIWEDSRLLAEMMIVPSMSSDPFWENEARTVLTAAIARVCYSNPPEERPMRAVLDILYGGPAWEEMLTGLRMAIDVHVMTQHATALSSMNEKTLSSVLQTARSSLGAWAGERVGRATSASDWNPLDLRGETNPTIYIYIRPNEVEAYLSLLRVFIGQHIRILTGGAVPPRDAPPILFMLDELPRLRNMPPVDEALNIGRKYGLRLWMFAQSVGQFQATYPSADGMLGACAVRVYMNPGGADKLAEQLSEELGYVESINDNSRKRLVEAAELAGPNYRNLQIVFGSGGRPATVSKDFAYDDPEVWRRASMSPPAPGDPALAISEPEEPAPAAG